MNWLGQGPYRVYKNRLAGQEIFGHTKTFNYGWTGQTTTLLRTTHGTPAVSQWTYPEFEGFHGQLLLGHASNHRTTHHTRRHSHSESLPARPHAARHGHRQRRVIRHDHSRCMISLLHGISPIGNKFDAPSATGPAGQTNVAAGLYTGEAHSYLRSSAGFSGERTATTTD